MPIKLQTTFHCSIFNNDNEELTNSHTKWPDFTSYLFFLWCLWFTLPNTLNCTFSCISPIQFISFRASKCPPWQSHPLYWCLKWVAQSWRNIHLNWPHTVLSYCCAAHEPWRVVSAAWTSVQQRNRRQQQSWPWWNKNGRTKGEKKWPGNYLCPCHYYTHIYIPACVLWICMLYV